MVGRLSVLRPGDRIIGALFTVVVVFAQTRWLGNAVILLSIGLFIVYVVWAVAPWKNEPARVLPVYLLAIVVHCLHFAEEFAAGFQRQFPNLFESEWNDVHFVTFNMVWLTVFVLGALGVHRRMPLGYLGVIFLAAIGGVGNGASHLLLSAMWRRYFPGAITAPVCLIVGVAVLTKLFGETPARREPE
jgi:hypothetical protein